MRLLRRLLPASLALLALFVVPAAALGAGLGAEVNQGRGLADAVRSGQRDCRGLSADQLELIGEYAMDRFLGNRSAHEAMNVHMVQMMGAAGEQQMHIGLGQRYAGCGGASAYGWMGPMIGMMGGYGRGSGYPHGVGPGMMGGRYGFGMMGGYSGANGHGNDDDFDAAAVVGIAFGAALLGGLLVALGLRTRRPRVDPPLS